MAATSGQGISHRTHLDDVQNRLGANSEHEVLGQIKGVTVVDNAQKVNQLKLSQGRSQMVNNTAVVHVDSIVDEQREFWVPSERRLRDTDHMRANPDIYEVSPTREVGVKHAKGDLYSPFDASVPKPTNANSEYYTEKE
jgi:hypothetical protein